MIITRDNVKSLVLEHGSYWDYDRNKLLYIMRKDYTFQLSNGDLITIPAGYLTDFRTCPNPADVNKWYQKALAYLGQKGVELVVAQTGRHNVATLIHDYLYTHRQDWGRKFSDLEMDRWNAACEVPDWQAKLMLKGVQLAGQYWWDH